ncbi:MAG: LysR substrate-binding domain-containing protein [Pseudomonadota bacterium]
MDGSNDPAIRQAFLEGMSHAAATVNIVTTDGTSGRAGVTVSAMTSVSADTPRPTLLVCVHHTSEAAPKIAQNGVFCVNLLRDDQSFISDTFAGRFKEQFADKFECAEWEQMQSGAPRVVDPLVAFDCRLVSKELVGTHHVFVGEVVDIFTAARGTPLIYANRAYGRAVRIDPVTSFSTAAIDPALRIGCFHTFAPFFIPKIVERFARDDATDVRLTEGDHRRLIESVRAGEVDLALMYDFDLPDDIEAEPLAELVPHILLAEDHPLAEDPDLSMEKLADAPMILLEAPPTSDYVLSLFAERGLSPHVKFHCPSFELVRGLVGQRLGYAIMATKPATRQSYDGHALVTRPLPRDARRAGLVIASRKGATLPEAAGSFRAVCRGIFT